MDFAKYALNRRFVAGSLPSVRAALPILLMPVNNSCSVTSFSPIPPPKLPVPDGLQAQCRGGNAGLCAPSAELLPQKWSLSPLIVLIFTLKSPHFYKKNHHFHP